MSGNARAARAALALLALAGSAAACDAPDTGRSPRDPPPPRAAETGTAAPDELVQRIKADLAGREQVSVESIRTLSAEAVVWRDMSMGCGRPTESYAQVETEGFRIVLEHKGQKFDYRARSDGSFVLCDPASLQTPRGRIPPG